MRLELSDGSTVRITPVMAEALREAEVVLAEPMMLRLRRADGPTAAAALDQLGLAVYDSGSGRWMLTRLGREAREQLTEPTDAHRDRPRRLSGPGRVTVHPDLTPGQARRLRDALRPAAASDRTKGCGAAIASFATYWTGLLGMTVLLALTLALLPAGWALPLSVVVLAGGIAGTILATSLVESRPRRAAKRTVESLKDGFVTADMLDEEARALLVRAQEAVDAVLGSPLHRRGLLLDGARNRVVLADVEWSLARSLLRQSEARRVIGATPTPGERSRRAAERAREALGRDAAEVAARVELLESYAAKVRAAEAEEQDRRSASALEEIAADVAREGAAHSHHTEELACLVRAQEAALEIAALTDPSP